MHTKNILYLSYDGLTDPLGQSQILPYLIGLSQKGYYVSIISAEKRENFDLRKELISKIVEENTISWHPLFYTKKPPVLSTLWDIYRMQQLALQLHKRYHFKVVHCRSYISALIGLQLKRKTGVNFIFDMRGFWADERVEGGLWKLSNPVFKSIYTYFKNKEKQFLREADYTISLTHQAKQIIHGWPGLSNIPIQVIPCCVDTEVFRIPPKNSQGSSHETATFTISYLGSLGTWYMLEEMLQFFKRLLLHKPQAQFLFITPDNPQFILQSAADLAIPAEKIIIRKAERKEVPALLASSKISIFFIKPSFSKQASSPTKMGEILSMGIPVICNAGVGDTDYLFETYKTGILVKELNPAGYDLAISEIEDALNIPPEQLRATATTYFDLQKGVYLYKQVYDQLFY
ncbi:glycosyltransferase family 4 protein [Rhodocytophaga rosea]|uniref:Glycosyltransferase family 4 protein n=1 Tax=Rhodocytophaga rosea TaxID=2704465 RepID=A0A6C0GR66_9BACT|nr:glycosyltransferase [Rhodocytophaga rosea]QHT70558.1 glycosyltransferase family 4 protein [Rhodocytophaga rosea]